MAEPDNFEEDLFADLYTEDEVPQKSEANEPQVVAKPETTPIPEVNTDRNGHGDQQIMTFEQMFKNRQNGYDRIEHHNGTDSGVGIDNDSGGNGDNGDNNFESPTANEAHGPGIKEDG